MGLVISILNYNYDAVIIAIYPGFDFFKNLKQLRKIILKVKTTN